MDEQNANNEKNYNVPPKFKPILTDLIKEILINQPNDIIDFCSNYFKIKQEEFHSELNRAITLPNPNVNTNPNDDSNKSPNCNVNKKRLVSKKSTCKKGWDNQPNENNK